MRKWGELYSVLGVTSGVSVDEAQKKYRKSLRRLHPDLGGSAEEFIRLQELWKKAKNYGLERVFGLDGSGAGLKHRTLFEFSSL